MVVRPNIRRVFAVSIAALGCCFTLSETAFAANPVLLDSQDSSIAQAQAVISATSACDNPENLNTTRPSVISSVKGRSTVTTEIPIGCNFFGAPVPNCEITLNNPKAEAVSGGHDHHDDGRPTGTITPTSGVTGSNGTFTFTYEAPEVSGCVTISGSGFSPQYGFFSGTVRIRVEIPGLASLPPGENYELIGSYGQEGVTSMHKANHYALPTVNQMVVDVANRYVAAFPGQKLLINDMSLVKGGLFDIFNNWVPDHHWHRFGEDVDMDTNSVPRQNRTRLRQIIREAGFSQVLHVGQEAKFRHWHWAL